jgi:hypothetical protein
MITQSPYLRHCVISAIFVGVCGCLWGCAARSEMDMPEDDLPALPGTGGVPTPTVGTAGTSAATGGTSWGGGGAGGAPASGGAGGTPTTVGTGGGFIGSCEYPSCLWNLIRDCLAVGLCTQEKSQLPNDTDTTKLCCSNGTSEFVTQRKQGSRLTGTVAVTKNGNKCYDVNFTTSGDGNTYNYVWFDPSGQAVVKASIATTGSSTPTLQCGNGESMPMTSECAPDGSQAAEITTGTCQ